MQRGLVFAKYGALAASTRQRIVQTIPYLEREGITVDIAPLFDDVCMRSLFTTGKYGIGNIIKAYAKRMLILLRSRHYDFIWIQYELFPYMFGELESLLRLTNKPIIYDFDDAVFHRYDQHSNPIIRRFLGNKLAPLLKHCAVAFCGNAYLEDYAKQYCTNTHIIPTTVDINVYKPLIKHTATEKSVLGWIGSPSTWSYCEPMTDFFVSLVKNNLLSMRVVGAGNAVDSNLPFTFRDWSEENEATDIQAMDIGVMPLSDDPWARGKCGYKLIQYMACGLPVIASPVGVNRDIVEHGVNGFLASTEQEWRYAITALVRDAALRKQMGEAGRKKVEAQYAIQTVGPRIAHSIQELFHHFASR